MPRPSGARNAGYTRRRNSLIEKAQIRLSQPDTPPPSFRDLAAAAGVSATTLRHYFPSREALIGAVFAEARAGGERHLERARKPASGDLAASVRELLEGVARGWTQGRVGSLHRLGLAEGLRRREAGLGYLVEILEPVLQAAEERLAGHIAQGEMIPADTRHAALLLLAPLVLALLHQYELGGTRCRPLDMETLLDRHVEAFCRAYGNEGHGN
jgi:AcrR family transcriptional regulator